MTARCGAAWLGGTGRATSGGFQSAAFLLHRPSRDLGPLVIPEQRDGAECQDPRIFDAVGQRTAYLLGGPLILIFGSRGELLNFAVPSKKAVFGPER